MAIEAILAGIEQCLGKGGICVFREYLPQEKQGHGHAFVVLGTESMKVEELGLGSYLGTETDQLTGVVSARYGKKLTVTTRADIYADPITGAAAAEELLVKTVDLLLGSLKEPVLLDMTRERMRYDQETEMLVIGCKLNFKAEISAALGENEEYFTDFRLGDITING